MPNANYVYTSYMACLRNQPRCQQRDSKSGASRVVVIVLRRLRRWYRQVARFIVQELPALWCSGINGYFPTEPQRIWNNRNMHCICLIDLNPLHDVQYQQHHVGMRRCGGESLYDIPCNVYIAGKSTLYMKNHLPCMTQYIAVGIHDF